QRSEIRFVLPVHLFGHSLDLDRLAALASRGVTVVEDCAQAIAAQWDDRFVGTIGRAAGLSFYPTKNRGALGDGGALLPSDGEVAQKGTVLRNYGQSQKYHHELAGLNSRLDELQAAILGSLLDRLPGWTERRRTIAARYCAGLENHRIRIPQVPGRSR